jgi:hypothetical protein
MENRQYSKTLKYSVEKDYIAIRPQLGMTSTVAK